VFASINWESKGPRLAALVEAVQLRPPTILFIDDNPMNRAEAQHFVPGIQVADETIIPSLLENPLFRGKDDRALSRLAQYKLLERRHGDEQAAGSDTSDFLRTSNIRISIEHDLEPHIDRAIELINRTNQLNFTKQRLPEDMEAARAELRSVISSYSMQAGIIRVRDNYGDYGYCGLYIMRSGASGLRLLQFCFSCRILNMGVEAWLYRHLGHPALKVVGEVLTDVIGDRRDIDWITVELPEAGQTADEGGISLDYVYARGGCDLHAVTHYFNMVAHNVYREFNTTRNGANMRFDHSQFANFALRGIAPAAKRAFSTLGYQEDDYTTVLQDLPASTNAAWVLSFWADGDFALYRHRESGECVPLSLPAMQTNHRDMTVVNPEKVNDEDTADILRALQADFDYAGMIGETPFKDNVRLLLAKAPPEVRVFILLANELPNDESGRAAIGAKKRLLNGWTRQVAEGFANVELIDIRSFVRGRPEMLTQNHFDRMVYFRVFRHIMDRLREPAAGAIGAAAA
jgi:hypothetical protein